MKRFFYKVVYNRFPQVSEIFLTWNDIFHVKNFSDIPHDRCKKPILKTDGFFYILRFPRNKYFYFF